ncbi:hypothetical protein [Azospirillum brasilense]|uniref:hypothetical protein n=1 Tax=Azospirillum brasilense TaxID=192 RepID=UPI001EDC39C5|nr:hypothetical protein [Azospirillum brasilense]UKJ74507.1 hypothetical protein H1Q64_18280 [Azospirillum brasilense]
MPWTDWLSSAWFPAISSSTVLAAIGYAVGTAYKAKIENSIKHKYDAELEKIKFDIRKKEENTKSELRRRDEQILALRSGALSGMANRNSELDKRRIEASEKLWSSVIDYGPGKGLVKITSQLQMTKMIDLAAQNNSEGHSMRQFAEMLYESSGTKNFRYHGEPDKARLFISPIAWALFSAYRSILGYVAAQVIAMKGGLGREMFSDQKPLLDLIKAALPHQATVIEKYGIDCLSLLIDELEEKLLTELVSGLESTAHDERSVGQAAKILAAVDRTMAVTSKVTDDQPTMPPEVSELRR